MKRPPRPQKKECLDVINGFVPCTKILSKTGKRMCANCNYTQAVDDMEAYLPSYEEILGLLAYSELPMQHRIRRAKAISKRIRE